MILNIIIYHLLIALAAMFKAASDVCADHYYTSIFTRFNNPMFWDKSVSWQRKYRNGWQYWDPISDAWHISNGGMISCFIAAGYFFPAINFFIVFITSGVWFTVVFNTFYNHILKVK